MIFRNTFFIASVGLIFSTSSPLLAQEALMNQNIDQPEIAPAPDTAVTTPAPGATAVTPSSGTTIVTPTPGTTVVTPAPGTTVVTPATATGAMTVVTPAQKTAAVASVTPANYTIGAPGDCSYTDEDNILTIAESTLASCAMECDNNDSCTSFIFNKINNKCILTDLLSCSLPQANNEQQIYYKKALNQNAAPGTVTAEPEITGKKTGS